MSGYDQCVESADGAGFSSSGGGPNSSEGCPLHGQTSNSQPCYIDLLRLTTTDGKQVVEYSHAKRGTAPARVLALTRPDDLLLQIVSDPLPKSKGGSPKEVNVAGVSVPSCPQSAHPTTDFMESGNANVRSHFTDTSETFECASRPTGGLGESFFDTYWPFGKKGYRSYLVSTQSCGIPVSTTDTAPREVTGRIEAYRPNSLAFEISLPPLRSSKSSRADQFEITTRRRTTSRSEMRTGDFGRQQDGGSFKHVRSGQEGDDYVRYTTTQSLSNGKVSTYTDQSGMKSFQDAETLEADAPDLGTKTEAQTIKGGTGVKLIFNGQNQDAVKFIGNLLKLPSEMSKFVDDIKNSVPKIGWTADISVEVLVGTFRMDWYLREKDKAEHDTCWLIDKYVKITVDCTLFKAGLSIGFGLEWVVTNPLWDPPLVEVILKVSIGVEAKCYMKLEFENSRANTFQAIPGVESKPNITATAKAMVNGVGVKAECKIETGIDGKFTFKGSMDSTPGLTGELSFLPIAVTAELVAFSETIKQELFKYPSKPVEIWKADILKPSDGNKKK